METIGNIKLILIPYVKMKNVLIMIIKLVIKYLYGNMVFFAKQSLDGLTNHVPSSQFIRMEKSGLDAETSPRDLTFNE